MALRSVKCRQTVTGKLRPQQQAFQAKGWPVQIVRSVDEAIDVVMEA